MPERGTPTLRLMSDTLPFQLEVHAVVEGTNRYDEIYLSASLGGARLTMTVGRGRIEDADDLFNPDPDLAVGPVGARLVKVVIGRA